MKVILIYEEDHKELEQLARKNQTFADKIHEMILKERERMKGGKE